MSVVVGAARAGKTPAGTRRGRLLIPVAATPDGVAGGRPLDWHETSRLPTERTSIAQRHASIPQRAGRE